MSDETPILVVEDDVATQKLLETLIARQGLATRIVSNGAEAINCLRDGKFACIILDLMMPEVGGHDVIDFLASEKRNIPVIVCTAAGARATEHLNASVVRAVIRKPFDIDELAAVVMKLAGVRD